MELPRVMQRDQRIFDAPGHNKVDRQTGIEKVLIVGQRLSGSAPTLTLATQLNRIGIVTSYSEGIEGTSTRRWLKRVIEHDAIIFVEYCRPALHLQRQFHLAQLLGCPVIRWWVGTDVYNCLRSEEAAEAASRFDNAVSANIAVAPHLVGELAKVGISAAHVPSICSLPSEPSDRRALDKNVLVYLPGERKEFYGRNEVLKAIEAHPELQFTVVADESHSLAHYRNVDSLGWVENMQTIWPRIGALLRITEHDGLPRMVLEALALKKQVLYSWPLQGCTLCRSGEDAISQLADFKRMARPNHAGPEAARQIGGDALSKYLDILKEVRGRDPVTLRVRGLRGSISCQTTMKFPAFASRRWTQGKSTATSNNVVS